MAAPPPPTYAFIPAPPLPEFYLPKKADSNNDSRSSSSASAVKEVTAEVSVETKTKVKTSKQCQIQARNADEAVKSRVKPPAVPGDATDETMLGFTNGIPRATREVFYKKAPIPGSSGIPLPLHRATVGYDVPPLAVYHICRICVRPRSARYHREHPIPINGVPPPPGICRRCRVTRVVDEEVVTETIVSRPKEPLKLVEVVTHGESNEIKIGVAAFSPPEEYVTRDEMKHQRGQSLLKEADRQHRHQEKSEYNRKEKDVTYRYVRVRETRKTVGPAPVQGKTAILPPPPPEIIPPPPPPEIPTSPTSTAQDAIDAVSARSPSFMMTTAAAAATVMQGRGAKVSSACSVHTLASAKLTQVDKSISKQDSISASSSTSKQSGSKASAPAAEVVSKPEHTEADIRRIAREEVERYRQAERKLEAHPGAWAHGRMVPVQRRIEQVADSKAPLPWRGRNEHVKVHLERERVPVRSSAPPSCQPEESPVRPPRYKAWDLPEIRAESVQCASNTGDAWGLPEPSQRAPSTAKGWDMPDPDSNRSGGQSHPREDREVIIERVARRGSQAGSQKTSSNRASRARAQVEDAQGLSDILEVRSAASDKTRWLPAGEKKQHPIFSEPDPPQSAKMREVFRWDNERHLHVNDRQAGSQADSRVSAHVQELRDDAEREERASSQPSFQDQHPASVRSSKPSEHRSWRDEDSGKTVSIHSNSYREAEVDLGVRYRTEEEVCDETKRGPSAMSGRTEPSQRSQRTQEGRGALEASSKAPKEGGRVRAFHRRWAAAKEAQDEQIAEWVTERKPERDGGNTRQERRSAPAEPARSTSSAKTSGRDYDREYIYTERTVQPARGPERRRPGEKRHSDFRIESEKLWRFNIPDEDLTPRKAPQQKGRERVVQEEQQTTKKVSPSETSTRVRFANKVEFSPTPPGSDASSSQFRVIGPQGRRKGGEGRSVGDVAESAEDLITEYERRGRARARDRGDRAAPVGSTEVERTYYHERDTWGPSHGGDGAAETRDGEGNGEKGGEVHDAAYRPRKSRPLATALSESPSRERLSEMFSEHRSKVSSLGKVDGNGPYRPEQPKTESMDVLNGSLHPIPEWGPPEESHGHGGWNEGVTAGGGGGNAW